MTVELICVGTELLLGNIINTNAAFLAEQCAALGLSCYYQTVVGDNRERLIQTVQTALSRSDIVLLSGGLGPTKDDLTKEAVAEALGLRLVEDEVSHALIAEYFKVRGKAPTENNWTQALVPEGGRAIRNHNGTAPGILIEKDGKRIVLMPGPPNELESMFMEEIVPYLCTLGGNVIASVTVKLTGIGESSAETKVADLMEKQDNPTLAPYAKTGEVHFRVTARAETEAEAAALNEPLVAELKRRFGSAVYTTDEKVTLERAVVDMLLARGLTMTVAESCTGGMLAARLVNVSGVSEVFKAGFVTYANEAKSNLIHVKEATLAQFGAVSRETAQEMAQGAAKAAAADVAVAITGIAGPDGGTEEKPVGLVYISCYVCGKTDTQEHHFIGSRMTIRERVTAAALTQLRRCLLTL